MPHTCTSLTTCDLLQVLRAGDMLTLLSLYGKASVRVCAASSRQNPVPPAYAAFLCASACPRAPLTRMPLYL